MNNIFKAWHGGHVRRWHTHPAMVDTCDPDSAHQHRCTIMYLLFWPDCTRDALIDCLVHDQGEHDAADVSYPVKRKHPIIKDITEEIEDESIKIQGFEFKTTDLDIRRRKFVDLLDSYLWMLRYKPFLRNHKEWKDQKSFLFLEASSLKVATKYQGLMEDFEVYYTGFGLNEPT